MENDERIIYSLESSGDKEAKDFFNLIYPWIYCANNNQIDSVENSHDTMYNNEDEIIREEHK